MSISTYLVAVLKNEHSKGVNFDHFCNFSPENAPSPPGPPCSETRWIPAPTPVTGSHIPIDLPERVPGHLTYRLYSTTVDALNVTGLNVFTKRTRHVGFTRSSHTCRRHLSHCPPPTSDDLPAFHDTMKPNVDALDATSGDLER